MYSFPGYCQYADLQISLPLNIYPVIGFLNHIVVLFLFFLRNLHIMFYNHGDTFYCYGPLARAPVYSHLLERSLVTVCLLTISILPGVACYPTEVLYFSGNYPLYSLVSLSVK